MQSLKIAVLLAVGSAVAAPAWAQPAAPAGCAAKVQDIQAQLEQARKRGNRNRVNGLEKALRETRANCTDASLRAEREREVAKHEREVEERRKDLREAEAERDPKEIDKRRGKLADALAELSEARRELQR